MTKTELANYLLGCAKLAEDDDAGGLAYVRPDALTLAAALLCPAPPAVSPAEAFERLRESVGDQLDGVDARNPLGDILDYGQEKAQGT